MKTKLKKLKFLDRFFGKRYWIVYTSDLKPNEILVVGHKVYKGV